MRWSVCSRASRSRPALVLTTNSSVQNAASPDGRVISSAAIATNEPARTVTFHLKAPDADFLTKLALPFAFAVPASRTVREARTHRVPATGPYMIASYAKRIVRLVRNPRFREWSADAQPNGFPDVITFTEQKTPDPLARAKAIEAGVADIAPGYGPPLTTQQIRRSQRDIRASFIRVRRRRLCPSS